MNPLERILLSVLLALTAGCASAPEHAPKFVPAPQAPDGYATLYIYRFSTPPYTYGIKVSLAGKPFAEVLENGYAWVHLKAGTHTLYAKWPDTMGLIRKKQWPDATATQEFEPGKSYYFRVVGDVSLSPGGLLFGSSTITRTGIVRRSDSVGIAELTACCRQLQSDPERID